MKLRLSLVGVTILFLLSGCMTQSLHPLHAANVVVGNPRYISPAGVSATHPRVAIDSKGRVHVVWIDGRRRFQTNRAGRVQEHRRRELYHIMCSEDSWTNDQRLAETGELGKIKSLAIDADSTGGLHIVWRFEERGGNGVMHGMLTGASWGKPFRLGGGWANEQSIVAGKKGTLHVVWEDNSEWHFVPLVLGPEPYTKTRYRKFDGQSWGAVEELNRRGRSNYQYPVIGVDTAGDLHLIYVQTQSSSDFVGRGSLVYRRWTKHGWSGARKLGRAEMSEDNLDLTVDANGHVHVMWMDALKSDDAPTHIYRRLWDGKRWSKATELSREADEAWYVSVASDTKGNTYYVWGGEGGVFCKRWNGAMWSQVVKVIAEGGAYDIDVGTDDAGNVHLVWVIGGRVQYQRIESLPPAREKSD